ncbi:carbamoyltransferase HypF [Dissulfurirhabdus thermomarina]|uniref:Carbamoyltransferase n=1 Tax=Dissulfurirhabdus thermomarina TaxID=1765737 RepID=A0A6N9TMU4_DISTH|nr:carbamoyltransferase HypF [Dissulfurirhabdus thermomarina]NDY42602.1 carbamoyltransferase HypF [Dissulfurirhabdus thermomarina]NMX22653.1 carbamoyltransferase HypF [Dissulfurirhabdus thermomarina]
MFEWTGSGDGAVEAWRIEVTGTVQGVGFRPCVFREAVRLGLSGTVANIPGGVEIRVEGPRRALEAFCRRLREAPPPLARIRSLTVRPEAPGRAGTGFRILSSREDRSAAAAPVAPDVATCGACRAELFDPADRRHRYPFLNCTDCGPRYTIVESVPYDRPRTTMKGFAMCDACEAEYRDPANRRFHAQPNACPRCGPRLALLDAGGRPVAADPLREAAERLARGEVVAVKGLGGVHLAVDAAAEAAVARLRARKGRPSKPLALMARDLATARRLGDVGAAEAALLEGARRPIVLLLRRPGAPVAPNVAPGVHELGVMLPYTPLHHLLFAEPACPPVLVMTSGNRSGSSLCAGNDEALERLAGIADAFLLHDRPIAARTDDSVVRVAAGAERVLRRARGYVPEPVALPRALPAVFGAGAALKNTFCLVRGAEAVPGPHVGDLEDAETFAFYQEAAAHLSALLRLEPEAAACDLHPDYLSTRYARGLGVPVLPVQHHHAHAVAVMAEHGLEGPVLAVVFDGAGLGPDGTIWGGEFLLARPAGFRRLGSLRSFPLPGGDAAAREPWRPALALLRAAGRAGGDPDRPPGVLRQIPAGSRAAVLRMMELGLQAPATTSAGRLFDGVAALLGLRARLDYEGQAAMELEALAHRAAAAGERPAAYPVALRRGAGGWRLDFRPAVRGVLRDIGRGAPPEVAALAFHRWLSAATAALCRRLARETGAGEVVLGGGCFQNRLLLEDVVERLTAAGLRVYAGERVPAGDGGLALGQAAAAGFRLQGGA